MIATSLTGNLGNHLWNYVKCRIVAEKLGYDWAVDPVPTHDYYSGQEQMYFMNVDYGKDLKKIGINNRQLNVYENIHNEYYDIPNEHTYNGDTCSINFYDPGVFGISDNTMIHLRSQSELYLIDRKDEVSKWFEIKNEFRNLYEKKLVELGIILDENLCVINFRGGEYRSVPNLIPRMEYYRDSINQMKLINPSMRFLIMTDDVNCAKHFVGDYPCLHIDIGFDFYVVSHAKYLIISNSTFSWWSAWLNKIAKFIIAPKYWFRHNVSNGYWSVGDSYTTKFNYMDREGKLSDFFECKREAQTFYKSNCIPIVKK